VPRSLAGVGTSNKTPLPQAGEGQGRGKPQTLANAKSLRTNQTEAEARLWYHLRAHRFMGLKFKRQKPVGRYIADFVCCERRLIIELDGGQHSEQVTYDQRRDAWLRSRGYTVLRFWNNDVMQQLEGVLEQIRCAVGPSPLAPLPQEAGEGN
jgi:very-short-patch-repair endonuclease